MAGLGRLVRFQTALGKPVEAGGVTVTPEAKAIVVRLPFGGWVWNRPTAVHVRYGQQNWRLPIVDVNLTGQLALVGVSLLFILFGVAGSARRIARR